MRQFSPQEHQGDLGVAGDNKTSRDSEEIVDLRRTVSVLRLFSLYCTVCRKRPEFYSKPDRSSKQRKKGSAMKMEAVSLDVWPPIFFFCADPESVLVEAACLRSVA